MLFNSYFFIFVFLPVTLAVFFALGKRGERRAAVAWLVTASLFFYGWWNPAYLGLIVGSILFNYTAGTVLGSHQRKPKIRRASLVLAIALNLIVLGYYKYAGFFLVNVNAVFLTGYVLEGIVLPLGISFFTFTQIAYLVDAYRGEAREYNFLHYALFVTYFPHLIAGPILHHKEMMPQFGQPSIYRFNGTDFAAGVTYFAAGLFKKVVIADGLAKLASPIFATASRGLPLTTFDAWGGVLAYTFQLYFDFSGYSDMAIGLALMIGIRLPLNFNSPYKAVNIIDFWRRWHMTLSRFLRDYLYFPLGGNRHGEARRYINLLVTMLLGGLWHGAGWTFVVWGGLHGIYLMLNHGWQSLSRRVWGDGHQSSVVGSVAGAALTFLAVSVGWVFFRSDNLDTAWRLLERMFMLDGARISPFYAVAVQDHGVARWLRLVLIEPPPELALVAALLLPAMIAFLAPNTQEIFSRYYSPPLQRVQASVRRSALAWTLSPGFALAAAVGAAWAILGLTQVSEFLYFQF